MRVGFVFCGEGFAALLYERSTEDAVKRSQWFRSSDDAMRAGIEWAARLSVPCDVVRVDTRLLSGETPATEGT